MKNIFVYGCGGLGREVIELIELINNNNLEWNIRGFIDDSEDVQGSIIKGYNVFTFEYVKSTLSKSDTEIVIAIGEPRIKKVLAEKVEQAGFRFAKLIHPNAYISKNVTLEDGTIITAGCMISTGVTIRKNVLINLGTIIGHDVSIYDNSSISLGCNISGAVTIEKNVFIGSGVNIRDEVSIGEGSIIGIGSTVTKNIRGNMLAYGNPAKEIKSSIGLKIF